MDIFIQKVRDYTCIIIKKNIFCLLCIIQNIRLIPCKYLFNIKRKVKKKNKVHVAASICDTYIVKKISTFILYYSKSQLRTKINCVPGHDIGGEVPSSENLSIFSHP